MEIPAGGGKGMRSSSSFVLCWIILSPASSLFAYFSLPSRKSVSGWLDESAHSESPFFSTRARSSVLVTGLRISVALEISSLGCYCRRQSSCLTMMTMTIDPTTTNHPSGLMNYTMH